MKSLTWSAYLTYTLPMRIALAFAAYVGVLAASATGRLLLGAVFIVVAAIVALTTPKS